MKKVATGLADTHTFAYEYQSTTLDTILKTLFSYFADHGIQCNHPNDFKLGKGTYVAVLNKKFLEISKERIDFGSTPNKSAIDMALLPKIASAIKIGDQKPYDNFEHFKMLLNFLIGFTFMLCSRDEHHELLWKNLVFSKVISGKNIRRQKIELVNLNNKSS